MMDQLPHGYTNDTVGDGTVVVKNYAGPDTEPRRARELAVLDRLADELPLPPLLADADDGTLRLGFVDGTHGQELLTEDVDAEVAAAVLAACGMTLAQIHAVDTTPLAELAAFEPWHEPPSSVLVHGDYGPNNLLLTPDIGSAQLTVAAVLDWEFARFGAPVDDIAWCEWVIRTHHRDRIELLDAFFAGYGGTIPAWSDRQAAMIARCEELVEFCDRWEDGGGDLWRDRVAQVAAWTE